MAIFQILANFPAFLDHTKKNVDVSKNDASTPNLVALPITSQELDRGEEGFFPPDQNRTYQIAQLH